MLFPLVRRGGLAAGAYGYLAAWLVGFAAPELRGLWVDAARPGIKSPAQISRLIRDARAAGFNSLFVQVRYNGEAYYPSELEPRAGEISGGFDPLAEVLKQAHDPTTGERLEVHAWLDTVGVWNRRDALPVDPRHVVRAHPEWISRHQHTTNTGSGLALDPGVPAVQDHLAAIVRELIGRYAVDGLYLEHLHYPADTIPDSARAWGFHPRAVERFQRLTGARQPPRAMDADWGQFRREQVTAILRRLVLEAGQVRPSLRISAGCVTGSAGKPPLRWESTRAFADVFQDWRQWLREGLLDTAVLKMYFETSINPGDWDGWQGFLQANGSARPATVLLGGEFNRTAEILALFRGIREAAAASRVVSGMGIFSYAVPASDLSAAKFFAGLTAPPVAADPAALFSEKATVPDQPWKRAARRGRLLGRAGSAAGGIDGARVELKGRSARSLLADANGWFGAVDLPSGDYALRIRAPETNRLVQVGWVTIGSGATATPSLMDADADADGDGYSNADELTAGTDPSRADSRLALGVDLLADRLSLQARPVTAVRKYALESSPDPAGPWRALTNESSVDGSEAVAPLPQQTVYFRVRVTY